MKKIGLILAVAMLSLVFMTGCSMMSSYNSSPGSADAAYEAPAEYFSGLPSYYNKDAKADDAPQQPEEPGAQNGAGMIPSDRKIIRNAELTIQALEFDSLMDAITAETARLGGYIESNSVSGSGYGRSNGLRSAEIVVRIPSDKLDEFLSSVEGAGNITSRRESVDDITDSYIDTEARLASLRTEYDTLLDLLSRAESLEDIIALQDRLTEVRYQIESYEARIRSYDSLIAYSTVSMNITEVERETAVQKESFGDEVKRRFNESLEDVGYGFERFAAWFIGNLPAIITVLVIIAIPLAIVLIVLKAKKKRRRKAAAEVEKTVINEGGNAPGRTA